VMTTVLRGSVTDPADGITVEWTYRSVDNTVRLEAEGPLHLFETSVNNRIMKMIHADIEVGLMNAEDEARTSHLQAEGEHLPGINSLDNEH